MTQTDPVVSCAWLAERLEAPDTRVVDATWFMPNDPRNAKTLYAERRIPGAVFFDIDDIADHDTDLPHMLPRPEVFASRVRKLGIGDGSRVVVYDNQGIFTGPRVWWMFRVMGHDDVFILDGGFPAWERGGFPIEDGPPQTPRERHFTARMRTDLVRDIEDVRKRINAGAPILDARPAPRFRAEAPEPRAGLRGGHMPGALNVPFATLINENGELRPSAELEAVFKAANVDTNQSAVCSCGSGVTAAVIALALARLGKWDAAVYDGSWTEWGGREDTPIVTGA
jgi:thiosulfate/3-mercaptopyruvate sulfurtransferase